MSEIIGNVYDNGKEVSVYKNANGQYICEVAQMNVRDEIDFDEISAFKYIIEVHEIEGVDHDKDIRLLDGGYISEDQYSDSNSDNSPLLFVPSNSFESRSDLVNVIKEGIKNGKTIKVWESKGNIETTTEEISPVCTWPIVGDAQDDYAFAMTIAPLEGEFNLSRDSIETTIAYLQPNDEAAHLFIRSGTNLGDLTLEQVRDYIMEKLEQ